MAIKTDRQVDATEISYFFNNTSEAGVVLSTITAGSGVALDSPKNEVGISAAASGAKPVGLLLNEFVNVDRTRTPLNWYKDQQSSGDKSTLLTKGWVATNMLVGTPSGGMLATLDANGKLAAVAIGTPGSAAVPLVGRWRSTKNEDGYAKVYIDL